MSEYRREVVATQKGYYAGKIQNIGDHFVILEPKAFSDKWMKDPEAGASQISDEDRQNAAAAHAGAVGIAGQTVEFEGKAMTRDDVIDQAVIGPTENGNKAPKASKRSTTVTPPTEQIISQGMIMEVPAGSKPAEDPVKDETGRFAPSPEDGFTAIARPAGVPKPSKRQAPAVAGKKQD